MSGFHLDLEACLQGMLETAYSMEHVCILRPFTFKTIGLPLKSTCVAHRLSMYDQFSPLDEQASLVYYSPLSEDAKYTACSLKKNSHYSYLIFQTPFSNQLNASAFMFDS